MENVTQEQIEDAAKIANAHEFILQTEQGYQTNIGDRGTKLSGGQRQRIAIARAVLKNPPILILDETTSALDTESERLVQEALSNLMKYRTSLVIAHRLSTIRHADEIIMLQNGIIVERGDHDTLINNHGLYSHLCELQAYIIITDEKSVNKLFEESFKRTGIALSLTTRGLLLTIAM